MNRGIVPHPFAPLPPLLDARRELRRRIRQSAKTIFLPPPTLTVSEWSDLHRRLPSTSAEPGQWRTARAPYLKRIMDVLGSGEAKEVVFAKSSQVGGSSCAENMLGFLIDQAPCAVLEVWPTEKMLKAWSLTRLDAMIQATPVLTGKFPKSGRRDSSDSIAYKAYPGGWIQGLTAKSTSDLRAHSARVAVAEEVDEWEGDLKGQGDPLELLRTRMRTFWNGLLFIVSTPTLQGFSRVWRELESSTWEEYWVPCPHCGHMQTLRWRDGDEDPDAAGSYRLTWEKDDAGEPIEGTVQYVCEDCGAAIDERYKEQMVTAGEWRAKNPGRTMVGFHINTLYSLLCPWIEVVRAYHRGLKDEDKMKSFVNTMLGLPYVPKGGTLQASAIVHLADAYPKRGDGDAAVELIPAGVGLLTAGVDVQGDRLELVVWGWGATDRWVIEWKQIHGDPAQLDVWRELEMERLKHRPHESGATLQIRAMCVDAGYLADSVHGYCDGRPRNQVLAIIGKAGPGRKLLEAPDPKKYKRAGKKRPTHMVGIDSGKSLLMSALRVKADEPGRVHFPDTLDPVFYDQLTSERLVTKRKLGRAVRVWELIAGRRNEALDCSVYAEAALSLVGKDVRKKLPDIVKQVNAIGLASAGTPVPQTARPSGRRMLSRGLDG